MLPLDANERWGPRAKITAFARHLRLHNVLDTPTGIGSFSHPCITKPTRGTTIDYVLVRQNIVEHNKYVTVTPCDLQTLGNHRGIIIDVDTKALLQATTTTLSMHSGQKLCSDNPNLEKKYLKQVINRF